jgi:hypothetical protein
LAAADRFAGPFVLTAFLAAADRSAGPLVADAFRAALDLSAGERRCAADRDCFESASRDAGAVLSFFRAFSLAWDRAGETGS